MKHKELKLVIKDGIITAIYDDALTRLFPDADVSIKRASHVEPDGRTWSADLRPVSGPMLTGFTTRQAALDAEVAYLKERVVV
jgi:hypothetical protein